MIAPSQGVHRGFAAKAFFPGETAMIVPKTSDGRVIFIIPWHDHAIVGTTDTPIPEATLEPIAQSGRDPVSVGHGSGILEATVQRSSDVLSVFTGIRPLVKGDKSARTASLSRDHVIRVSPSGLMTITGGKWTTVRKMAEDCVDRAIQEKRDWPRAHAPPRRCGFMGRRDRNAGGSSCVLRNRFGTIQELESRHPPSLREPSDVNRLSNPQVRSHLGRSQREWRGTVEDVLARRTHPVLGARTLQAVPEVARLMAAEIRHRGKVCGNRFAMAERTSHESCDSTNQDAIDASSVAEFIEHHVADRSAMVLPRVCVGLNQGLHSAGRHAAGWGSPLQTLPSKLSLRDRSRLTAAMFRWQRRSDGAGIRSPVLAPSAETTSSLLVYRLRISMVGTRIPRASAALTAPDTLPEAK